MPKTNFELKPVPPFRLDLTIWLLRRRPHNLVDRWDGRTYRRVLMLEEQPVEVAITQTGSVESPLLAVEVNHFQSLRILEASLASRLTRILGLDVDLEPFYQMAAADSQLRSLVEGWRGFKPPRFPAVFEALVNAIACQQLTLTLGIHLLNRMTVAFGPVLHGSKQPPQAFPRAGDLASLDPEAFRALGFSRSKGRAIISLAQGIVTGKFDLEDLEKMEESEVINQLRTLKGVGRWTAEYVLLRGLGHWSIFPGDDVGARRGLQTWLHLTEPLDYEGVRRLLAPWYPYAGFLYFHFLLVGLAKKGYVS